MMTGFELRLWRKGQGWEQRQAAAALGVSLRTWIRYEQGAPPPMMALAIKALSLQTLCQEMPALSSPTLRRRLQALAASRYGETAGE